MKTHWIFHKYKWTTYHTQIVFVNGFFQDYSLDKRYQQGDCECGAYKLKEELVDPLLEYEIKMSEFIMESAKMLVKQGKIQDAIDILK